MRSEKEMLELFRKTALTDENIRAAYIEGSRANPNAPKDLFQDYDVVYIVESTKPYRENKKWTDRFGETFYMIIRKITYFIHRTWKIATDGRFSLRMETGWTFMSVQKSMHWRTWKCTGCW